MSRPRKNPSQPRSSESDDDRHGRRPPIPLAWIEEPKGEHCPLCHHGGRIVHSHATTIFGGQAQARNRRCSNCGHTWGSYTYAVRP